VLAAGSTLGRAEASVKNSETDNVGQPFGRHGALRHNVASICVMARQGASLTVLEPRLVGHDVLRMATVHTTHDDWSSRTLMRRPVTSGLPGLATTG
jgi:hypothetical protein